MATSDTKLSIGLLAHNEEPRIGETLRSLLTQDVFERFSTELVIVANGCSDNTVAVARRVLDEYRGTRSARGSARVEELDVAGKANAWNKFVHHLSCRDSAVLVLVDSDIKFLAVGTISTMVATLRNDPHAVVCVDQPLKDIELKENPSFFERLIVAMTPQIDPNNIPLCGQLYCALSDELRQIKLPIEIQGEDGFLRAMLLTKGFTISEDRSRIVLALGAAHSYVSVTTIRGIFNHEKWLTSLTIVAMLLYERFWAEASPSRSAMALIEEWEDQDSHWLPHYIESQVRERGWRLLNGRWWIRRWLRLKGLPLARKARRLPVAAIATVVDAIIFVAAIRDVHRGRAYRYWGR